MNGVEVHVWAALRDDGDWLSASQIADHIGYSVSTVHRSLAALEAEGSVVRGAGGRRGRWHLAP